jgi:hypothetical protein
MFAVLAGIAIEARAQTVQTLIQFTNTWRYDQSGRDLFDTLWKTNTYIEDANWQPLSRGLLGYEPDTPNLYTIHAPITTPLSVSSSVTSFFFRTTFNYFGTTNGMTLFATNLVDDGCAIYLNGRQAGLIRLAANPRATVLAAGGTEGALDVVEISPGLLRQGINLMAVEVHQSSVGSSDVMFGMRLEAFIPTVLVITNQPVGDTIAVGDSLSLSVGVSGGPVFYQWLKDGIAIGGPNASSSTYNIFNAQLTSAGSYQVRVTNAVSSLLSAPAVVKVAEDTTGPKLISAVIRDSGQTNQIIIQFDETVKQAFSGPSETTNVANYRINFCGSKSQVSDVQILSAAPGGSRVQLTVGGPNWDFTRCYYLTVNKVPEL